MRGIYLISCILILVLNSCDIFDKEESIPGYISITSADLETSASQGANTSNIVDATVYADDIFVGTFELPAIVPVPTTGHKNILIGAGIKNNGLTSDRQLYPFYSFYETELEVLPDATVPINSTENITFEYFSPGVNFEIENFEGTGLGKLLLTSLNNADVQQIQSPPDDVLTGEKSLKVILPPDTGRFDAMTEFGLSNLPKGSPMYLEIDFKGTVPLEIGIVLSPSLQNRVFALGLVPQDTYTKVYVELTNEISQQLSTNNFEIYLSAQTNSLISEEEIYIDNLKFVYP